MMPDPIVDEVRAIRDAIAKEHDYDIDAIFEAFRRLEEISGRVTVPAVARESLDVHDAALPDEGAAQGSTADEAARHR
ncbi:hypothetical protein WMF37_30135 [Sorangium sp. So ce291]|uniref:hypothetical protein n=1 Tax=unclassified Sorangium TaxID=2621164 RepID=UPI003F0B5A02